MATAPISKEAFLELGVGFAGHTEFLAKLCEVKRSLPMFMSPKLNVTLATTHVPITKLSRTLTKRRVTDAILLTHMHPDHSAGLTEKETGKPIFENAELVCHENEPRH